MNFTECANILSPGRSGTAEIRIDSPSPLERLRGSLNGQPLGREKYTRLLVDGRTMMTDAEFERLSNLKFVDHARGDCLIAGLGIGLIIKPASVKCSSVTVIENNQGVIDLVGPSFPGITLLLADAEYYIPERKYDSIYLDIWPDFNEDVVAEAADLKRRYRRYLSKGGWIGDWPSRAWRLVRHR